MVVSARAPGIFVGVDVPAWHVFRFAGCAHSPGGVSASRRTALRWRAHNSITRDVFNMTSYYRQPGFRGITPHVHAACASPARGLLVAAVGSGPHCESNSATFVGSRC